MRRTQWGCRWLLQPASRRTPGNPLVLTHSLAHLPAGSEATLTNWLTQAIASAYAGLGRSYCAAFCLAKIH